MRGGGGGGSCRDVRAAAACRPCECCAAYERTGPCQNATLCNRYFDAAHQNCGAMHAAEDPLFPRNAAISSWNVMVNHEIDIEIPASCYGVCTSVCMNYYARYFRTRTTR